MELQNYVNNRIVENKNKAINLGIQILRMLLCFWVLSFHCSNKNELNYFLSFIIKQKFYHVPCFCFISFYFAYNIFSEKNVFKAQKRIERLLIPYINWPLVMFIINKITKNKRKFSFEDLKLQLLLGRQIIYPLWYLFSMIFLTVFFSIISILFNNRFLFLIQLLGIYIYIVQYSQYYELFNKYTYKVRMVILDTLSILPLSVIGLSFASLNIINFMKENRKRTIFLFYLFIFLLFNYNFFNDLGGYKGIIHIFTSTFFFFGFYLLPLEYLYPWLQIIIKQITNYTNGIYCLHSEIHLYIKTKFHYDGNIKNVIIIYLVCYLISFFGNKLCHKINLKYLFI